MVITPDEESSKSPPLISMSSVYHMGLRKTIISYKEMEGDTCMERRITVTPAHFRPERIKRVAVYCRVSSRIDEQLRSVGSQAKYLIDKAIHHAGWAFQDIFIDICSGKKAENRPELQTMLSQGRSHLIDIILVRTISALPLCKSEDRHQLESQRTYCLRFSCHRPSRT